jgi:hypothetical protein
MLHRWHLRLAGPLVVAALLALAACNSSTMTVTISTGGSPSPTSTSTTSATATPAATGCAAVEPGSAPATPIPGFTSQTLFPSGAVMTPLVTAYGATGQFTIEGTNICYQGTVDQVNGPYSGHSSIFAGLLGAGWDFNSTFPYDGMTAARTCHSGANCFNSNGLSTPQHYISFENLTSPQTGFVTYHLRVAIPPASPSCSPAANYASQPITLTWGITSSLTYDLPPLTKGSTANLGSGYAGGNLYTFCSAGSASTILSFMEGVAQANGETLLHTTSTSFQVCLQQAVSAYFTVTITANSGNVWTLNQSVPALPSC